MVAPVRVVMFTGKGGVGKSTVAAGTAVLGAAAGLRTLVLSTDAAHSLSDAYGVPVGPEPTRVAERLHVQQVDAQLRFEQSWADIQRYLLSVLDVAGVDPVAAEELTVIPGAEEVLALLELRLHVLSGRWDLVVVDCAPTAETLRLLALPEALGWYMQRVLPLERRVVKALKPVLSRAAGVPMPGDDVFDAIERLHAELDEVHDLLTGPGASVRLVLTPEAVVLAEARRSYTSLSLFGYRVDGVVANRIFPSAGADDWRAGWVASQDAVLARGRAVLRGAAVVALGLPAAGAGRRRGPALPGRGSLRRRRPAGPAAGARPLLDHPDRGGRGAPPRPAERLARRGRPRPERGRPRGQRRGAPSPAHPAGHPVAPRGRRGQGARRRAAGPLRRAGVEPGGRTMSGPHETSGPDEEAVGSVGEEAAKLFDAMTGAMTDAVTDAGWAAGLAALAGQAAESLREGDDHTAPGSGGEPECRWCPWCRAVHLVRGTSPDVRDQLVSAGRSLLQAATLMLDHAATPPGSRRGPGVERIDLDSDPDGDTDGDPDRASRTPEEDW